jgi:hypothetical protein
MITIDDLMSCGGGDSGGGRASVVPGGDGQAARPRPRQMMMMEAVGDHQLTVSRIRTAVSMLGRRTGHARFRRGPAAAVVVEHPSSPPDHQQPPGSAAAPGVMTLGLADFVKGRGRDEAAAFSASASGDRDSSSLPSTTTLTSLTVGEGSVSNGRFPPAGGHPAGTPRFPAVSMPQQQPAASDYYHTPGAAPRSKCADRARSENDAGKAHAGRCHCSKKRY